MSEIFKETIGDETIRVSFGNYGQERDLVCTEEERLIFRIICRICEENNLDVSPLRLTRTSDNYVSVVMDSGSDFGAMDTARIKYTNRAKWIMFGPDFKKKQITRPEDVLSMAEDVLNAYRFNEPYL